MTKQEFEQYKAECDAMCNCPYLKTGKIIIGGLLLGLLGLILYHGVYLGEFTNKLNF